LPPQRKAGNQGSDTVTFTIDLTAPVVTITGIAEGEITNRDVVPHAETTDANPDRVNLTLNGNPTANDTSITGKGLHSRLGNRQGGNVSDP
jgi:hypothetical protein